MEPGRQSKGVVCWVLRSPYSPLPASCDSSRNGEPGSSSSLMRSLQAAQAGRQAVLRKQHPAAITQQGGPAAASSSNINRPAAGAREGQRAWAAACPADGGAVLPWGRRLAAHARCLQRRVGTPVSGEWGGQHTAASGRAPAGQAGNDQRPTHLRSAVPTARPASRHSV